jgi:hypothetical protein
MKKQWIYSTLLAAPMMCSAYETSCDASQCNIQGDCQAILAHHGVEGGFFVDASFLYAQAFMDNLDYVEQLNLIGLTGPDTISVADTDIEPNFHWRPGFKVGIGYIFCEREQWKLGLEWTHLNSKGDHSIPNQTLEMLAINSLEIFPIWSGNQNGQFLTGSEASWKLRFNTLDLSLGRDFFISRWISVYPYFGLRAAWIHQKYNLVYDSFWTITIPNSTTPGDPITIGRFHDMAFQRENHMDFHNNFKGIGFRFGTQFLMHITENFGIIGNIAASMLYGQFNINIDSDTAYPTDDSSDPVSLGVIQGKYHKNFHRLRTNLDTELGLQWENFFCCDEYRFELSASYAFSVWYDQLQLVSTSAGVAPDPVGAPNFPAANIDPAYQIVSEKNGNLQIHGVVVRAGFDF